MEELEKSGSPEAKGVICVALIEDLLLQVVSDVGHQRPLVAVRQEMEAFPFWYDYSGIHSIMVR